MRTELYSRSAAGFVGDIQHFYCAALFCRLIAKLAAAPTSDAPKNTTSSAPMEIEMDRIGPAIIACLLILAGIFYVYALTTLHQRIDHAAKAKALLTQQDLAKRKADPARKEQR